MLGELIPKQPSFEKMLIVIRPETKKFLKMKSEETHWSMSKIIRKALKEYFAGEIDG